MTPQQLRNSILQMAIEGKLVEQRPEEGTGEELYQVIQEEKEALIQAGKLKKQKPLPEITEEEIPFEIPKSWKWVRLVDVGDWGAGATPSRTYPSYYGGQIPWLKTGELNDGKIYEAAEHITELALHKTSVRINPKGSVLIAMYGATIGKLGILAKPMTTNQACCACIVFSNIFNRYLFYFLLAIRSHLRRKSEGGAQPNISRSKLIETFMPLPPYEEQKRIVEKIEAIFPIIDRYESAWQKLNELNKKFPEELQKSILQEAIRGKLCKQRNEEGSGRVLIEKILLEKERLIESGQIKKQKALPPIQEDEIPFDIPRSWEWIRLGSIGETNVGLTYKPGEVSNLGIIVLRSNNIQNGLLDYTDIVRVNTNIPMSKMCQVNDIIICARNGSKRLVGKAALIDVEGMSFGAFMAVYRSICNPYVLKYINSTQFRKIMLPEVGTTTINQITQDALRKCLVPLPPLSEQERITKKVDKIIMLINDYKKIFGNDK